MSAADDVIEMKGICAEIADLLRIPDNLKDRTNEIQRRFGRDLFGWNRINEFLRGKARRVDGWEKDIARRIRDELKRAERQRRDQDHLAWLAEQVEGMDGGAADVLQHLLRRSGHLAGAVAVLETDADFDQRKWGR
jgi:hypothetical protein